MSVSAMAEKLLSLAQADLDLAAIYEQALTRVSEPVIKERLSKYRQEHVSHFQELADCIVDMGVDMPRRCSNPVELVSRELSASGAAADLHGILHFLYGQEMITHRAYQEAAREELSLKAQALVDTGCSDEKQHVIFLEDALRNPIRGTGM